MTMTDAKKIVDRYTLLGMQFGGEQKKLRSLWLAQLVGMYKLSPMPVKMAECIGQIYISKIRGYHEH
jgi:hypothetical protein